MGDDGECHLIDVVVCEGNRGVYATKHFLQPGGSFIGAITVVLTECAGTLISQNGVISDKDDADLIKVKAQGMYGRINSIK